MDDTSSSCQGVPTATVSPCSVHIRGNRLVDQLMAEQDDIIRQLDELDAQIERTIVGLIQERENAEKSAA